MSRKRTIHPGAPTDEAVASCSVYARLAWAYLPCHADKLGRLEDKPFSLKLAILPTDQVDMDVLLAELAAPKTRSGHPLQPLIERYVGPDGRPYIQIRTFLRHQSPHPREAASVIPPPPSLGVNPGEVDSGHTKVYPGHAKAVPGADLGTSQPGLFAASPSDPDPDPDSDPDPVHPETRAPDPTVLVAGSTGIPLNVGQPPGRHTVHAVAQAPASGQGEVWATPPVTLAPAGVRAQKLIDLFGLIRSETIRGALPWRVSGGNLFNRAVEFVRDHEDDPEAQSDVELTMRMSLERAKASKDPQQTEPAFAFGVWASKFTPLREELRGLRQPVGSADKPCDFHRGGRNSGKVPRKHEIRLDCSECKHVTTRAGPRPAARPESMAEILGIPNAGGR